jgi:hypothetical protein
MCTCILLTLEFGLWFRDVNIRGDLHMHSRPGVGFALLCAICFAQSSCRQSWCASIVRWFADLKLNSSQHLLLAQTGKTLVCRTGVKRITEVATQT